MISTKIKQHIPFYKNNFANDPRWHKKETEHYIFFFFLDTIAAQEIEIIATRQEKAFNKIINFLDIIPPKRKIKYYLYSNTKIKKGLMGDDGYAQAVWHDFTVHIIYNEKINNVEDNIK